MPDSIWTGTLADFRDHLASVDPVPAGVTSVAVTASLGFALLEKVLAIAMKRKDFAGDRDLVQWAIAEARDRSHTLSRLADDDIAAFREYLRCLREKKDTRDAIRRTIEAPLEIAREAASGVALSQKTEQFVHAFVKPDFGIARALLAGAVNATVFILEANLEQLPSGDPYREKVTAEARQLLQNCETFMPLSQPIREDR